MKDTLKNFQNVGICLLILAALTFVVYYITPGAPPPEGSSLPSGAAAMGLRFLFFGLGAALVLGLCYATRENEAWEIGAQKPVYMAVGAILAGVVIWLTNGQTFNIPALSQVGLHPALAVAVFFGFTYGPVVGLMTGAGGYLIGDLFAGNVAPHWVMGYGLMGLAAGLGELFEDQRQAWDVAAIIAGLGGLVAAAFFLANPGIQFAPPPDLKSVDLSLLMGLSVLVGGGLAVAVRFAFPNRPEWGRAAVWGAAGTMVGLFLAALAEVWVSGTTLMEAIIGKFIPAAGPGLIAMAILVPLALALQAAAQESEARGK